MEPPRLAAPERFVGREREMHILRAKLDAARAGVGGIAMLVGEPGIGKTRTAQEFAADVVGRKGATVLWGRCYDGDWWPPYEPWIEAVANYVRAIGPVELRAELGAGASVLAQLVPAVRAALPDTPRPARLAPEEERFRLYDSLAHFLRAASVASGAFVLVLDDLHAADRASLGLLQYVARLTFGSPLLVIGTYRDVELDLTHPLAQCLADLNRERLYDRIPLRNLTREETALLLERLCGAPVAPAVADAIYGETDGNPFFIEEVVRHLQEEGRDLCSVAGGLPAWDIPETVRLAVGRRLARLSPEANRLLRIASAFMGGFDFAVLQALTGMPEAVLLDCIDEALRAKMIRATAREAETCEFAHGIMRHTLYDELNPSRKARLHRRVARALEQVHAERGTEDAAELAFQYHKSSSLPGAARGIPYALAAAEKARARYAHEHVVAFLRIAQDLAAESEPWIRADIMRRLTAAEAETGMLDHDVQRSPGFHARRHAGLPMKETTGRPSGLTRREVEVLGLLAEGRTNKEIAQELVVSVHTVERHVANIYGKTGTHNRAGATGYALRHHVVPS